MLYSAGTLGNGITRPTVNMSFSWFIIEERLKRARIPKQKTTRLTEKIEGQQGLAELNWVSLFKFNCNYICL